MKACGGAIQSTVHDLNDETLGRCELFEEKQVGTLGLKRKSLAYWTDFSTKYATTLHHAGD